MTSYMPEVLRRNNLKKGVDLSTASLRAEDAKNRMTSAEYAFDHAEDAKDAKSQDLLEEATAAASATLEGILLGMMALSQIGLDAETVLRLALAAEAGSTNFDMKAIVQAALAVHLGPEYHDLLALHAPRKD